MPQHIYNAAIHCPLSPREAFLRLRQYYGCVWLDSARSNPQGDARYSLVAANPVSRLVLTGDKLEQTDYAYTSDGRGITKTTSTLPVTDPLCTLEQWLRSFGRAMTEPFAASVDSQAADASAAAVQTDTSLANASEPVAFFRGGAVGYFSYEFGRQWEAHTPLPAAADGFPLMDWALYDCAIVCDHLHNVVQAIGCSAESHDAAKTRANALLRLLEQSSPLPATDASPTAGSPTPQPRATDSQCVSTTECNRNTSEQAPEAAECNSRPSKATGGDDLLTDSAQTSAARRAAYVHAVEQTRAYIAQGDIYQTNIAQHFCASLSEPPSDLYLRLRELNPAPYAAYLDTGAFQILSSSPELFLHKYGQRILTRPIKGTRPRGKDAEEDARLCRELVASEKERAELLMIVDLERNDLGRVCEAGSVRVESLYRVETYATVHHLLADVAGILKKGTTLSALLRATFPGGSITGAPKVRAMEIIDELERRERGIFCGAIGLLGADGSVDLNIAIRTLLCATAPSGAQRVHASVGAGLVWDSDPQMEYEETLHKAEALLKAINTQSTPRFI